MYQVVPLEAWAHPFPLLSLSALELWLFPKRRTSLVPFPSFKGQFIRVLTLFSLVNRVEIDLDDYTGGREREREVEAMVIGRRVSKREERRKP